MIKVSNLIQVYEVDGDGTKVPAPEIQVRSHWNRSTLVVLEIGGKAYTVASADLEAAICNATNSGSH